MLDERSRVLLAPQTPSNWKLGRPLGQGENSFSLDLDMTQSCDQVRSAKSTSATTSIPAVNWQSNRFPFVDWTLKHLEYVSEQSVLIAFSWRLIRKWRFSNAKSTSTNSWITNGLFAITGQQEQMNTCKSSWSTWPVDLCENKFKTMEHWANP